MISRWQATLALALAGSAACATRSAPYHLRTPRVSGGDSAELPPRTDGPPGLTAPFASPRPAPRMAPAALAGSSIASALRRRVGERVAHTSSLDFARAAVAALDLGVALDRAALAAPTGAALVDLAATRGGFPARAAAPGDLIAFDRVVGDDSASLLGVVVATDGRGVVEFVYLARGVVRRGFVAPTRPTERRDEHGQVLNTFVRSSDGGDPPATRYLAGQLYAGTIALGALAGR